MRKFYFLDKGKKWQGAFWLPQVLFFSLKGDIKPPTFLWHNKLVNDGCEHPSQCIYARKKAFELLPFWLFGSNLKILAINLFNRVKKGLRKKDSWEKMIETPIETPSILKDALTIYLVPSITAIHDFAGTAEYTFKLIYRDTQTDEVKSTEFPIALTRDIQPGISFEVTMQEPPQVGGVLHKESYGLHRRLFLKSEKENIAIEKNSAFDFSTRFPYKPQILKGRFSQANLIVPSQYKNGYNRLILKTEDDKLLGPLDLIERSGSHLFDYEKFNVHPSLMGMSFRTGGGHVKIELNEKHYRFFEVADSLYIIDGLYPEDMDIFKQKAETIRIALSILSGKFYGGECNYVTSPKPDFTEIEGVWYEMERRSVLSDRRIIDLQFFRTTFKESDHDYETKYKAVNKAVDAKLFSDLCNVLSSNEDLLHAAELVISGMGNQDPVQQGALYSVALETLTAVLGEKKAKDLKPVEDDAMFQKLKEDFLDVLKNYETIIHAQGISILQKKMETLNSPPNQDKLTKTFEVYGITLTDEDKAAIKNRNKYLHGRSPLKRELQFELMQISRRLHTLIVALLLKSVGYAGHIINLDAHAYINDEEKLFEFISAQNETIHSVVAELEKAGNKQDNVKFTKAKDKLTEYLDNNKLSNMVRII